MGVDLPALAQVEKMFYQCKEMITAWGMQSLLQAENIRDEAKGIALRGQLRSIYDKHITDKSPEHITPLQIQQVEAVLAIKDVTPDEVTPTRAKRRRATTKR